MDLSPSDARLANLVAAAALGLADRLGELGPAVAGIDPAAASALVALIDFSPGGSVRRLSQILGLSHSGAVRLVDRLEASGLVRRESGPDERSRSVVLTRNGHSAAMALREQRRSTAGALLEGLSGRQRAELTRSCEVLVANLTRQRLAQRAAGSAPFGGALCRWCDFRDCGRLIGRCPAANAASS